MSPLICISIRTGACQSQGGVPRVSMLQVIIYSYVKTRSKTTYILFPLRSLGHLEMEFLMNIKNNNEIKPIKMNIHQ